MLFYSNGDDPNLELQKQGYKDILLAATDVLQVSDAIRSSIQNSGENLALMDKNMSSLARSMGVTTQYSQLLKQELGRAVTEVALMGGKQEDINRLQKEFIEATNRTIVLSTENIEKLFAVSQVSGVSVKALETGFRNAGMETTHISDEMKVVYNTANSLGVNAQTVSNMVVTNLDKMNRFGFGTGVEGMAKMAAKAAAMRVDMGSTLQLADKLFSPEAAIDVASTLQRLGATSGALLDPLKLMDLAQNNVPELQNQLSELSKTFTSFDEKTGKFQIMPEARRQLKEVSDALGIDRTEFEKMALESAKIEKKLGEIDFSGISLNIDEDQKMMLANLSEFNKSKGDYTVKFTDDKGVAVEKALNELQQGDLDRIKLQQQTLDPQKELVNVAKEQLGAANTLIAQTISFQQTLNNQFAISNEGTKFLQESVKAQAEILKGPGQTFSLKGKTGAEVTSTVDELFGSLNKIITGELTDIADITTKIFTGSLGVMGQIADQQKEYIDNNPLEASVGIFLRNLSLVDETAKSAGINLEQTAKGLKTFYETAVITAGMIPTWIESFIKTNTTPPAETPTGELKTEKDVAITANGQRFSLSSGDLMMAVNQDALLRSIGSSGAIFNQSTAEKSNVKTNPKEIKISLDINANSNDLQVKNAILTALNHDDMIRTITDKIATVTTDYGLTT